MNWCTSLVRTVRANRLIHCNASSNEGMRKEGRGSVAVKGCKSDAVALPSINSLDNRVVSIWQRMKPLNLQPK